MDWTKCYAYNGQFNADLLFINKFGIRPNVMALTFNREEDKCDLEKLTSDLINQIIPDCEKIFQIVTKYSLVGKNENEFRISDASSCIYVITSTSILVIDSESITCRTTEYATNVEQYLKDIWDKFPKVTPQPREAIVKLVGFCNGDYYTLDSRIKPTHIDLNENYNDDFMPVHEDIVKFLEDRESGLILLFGQCGTGKTSYIRHLCSNYPKDYIIIPSSLITRLSDPDFVTFMIDNSDSVFILEDCEQVLIDRKTNIFNGAISNILNMSDGLLSDIMNLKFICTFNADIRTIDSALLRKGRCYAKYEFKELSEDKVKALNEKHDLKLQEIKPMTLADIYNTDKTSYSEANVERKIGF